MAALVVAELLVCGEEELEAMKEDAEVWRLSWRLLLRLWLWDGRVGGRWGRCGGWGASQVEWRCSGMLQLGAVEVRQERALLNTTPLCPVVQEKKLPPIYRGKWASASKEEVEEMMAKGVPHCYRFRVPKNQVVKIQVRAGAGWGGVGWLC